MAVILLHFAPYIAMAVMALGLWGLWEQHGKDELKHANDQAVIQQNLKDHAESAKQIGILQTKLENIDVRAQPIIQRIVTSPATSVCGPSVGFAVDGVRNLYDSGQVVAGSKPDKPAGVPTPLNPGRKP